MNGKNNIGLTPSGCVSRVCFIGLFFLRESNRYLIKLINIWRKSQKSINGYAEERDLDSNTVCPVRHLLEQNLSSAGGDQVIIVKYYAMKLSVEDYVKSNRGNRVRFVLIKF